MKYKIGDKVLYTCEDGLSEPVEALVVKCAGEAPYPYWIKYKCDGEVFDDPACDEELSPLEPEQLRQREQFWSDEDTTDYSKPTKGEMHRRLCEELNNTYVKKNYDYGDSYGQLRSRYPDSILIRLYDKFSRLERLIGGRKAKVEDESIEDTLLDLANYALLELVERRMEKE